jgi:hypothetical protein
MSVWERPARAPPAARQPPRRHRCARGYKEGAHFVIDVERHALLCSTLTRLAQRIGIDRRAKNITPSLAEYLTPQEAAE